jgi:glycosyltransferase involved in cell wall biosynthesis
MKTLEQLYLQHHGKVSDKWSLYLSEYDRLLASHRDRPINFLEIGIQNGGSLEIWSEFFRNANKLVGCDINPDCARLSYQDPRIAVIVGDANMDETERAIVGCTERFDIVIDDGSHTSGDIVKSFLRYFPKLDDGGIFIAEDLHCSYWQGFDGGLYHPYSSIAFFKLLADVINHEHWGVNKRAEDLLAGFCDEYRCGPLSITTLESIHSVEFVNSLCVVRKLPATRNVLGQRFIAGQDEIVVSGHLVLKSQNSAQVTPRQDTNAWSTLERSPAEAWQQQQAELAEFQTRVDSLEGRVAERTHQVFDLQQDVSSFKRQVAGLKDDVARRDASLAKAQQDIDALLHSTSWRITAPVRWPIAKLLRIRHIMAVAMRAVRANGGFKPATYKALELYRKEGVSGLLSRLRPSTAGSPESLRRNNYDEWIQRYDCIDDEQRMAIRQRVAAMPDKPLISVVMPTYNPKPEWLTEAIESVRNQLYPNWELCIADDVSTDPAIRPLLEQFAREDSRIKVVFREQNGHISAASNSALELAVGEWVALLDHDDLLPDHALYCVANAIIANPSARLIYSDEDKIDASGRRHDPYFKCDWNTDLFYSQNFFCHLGVYHKPLLDAVGGFRIGVEGSQDYDLVLRCIEHVGVDAVHHIPRVLYHWRVHAESTAGGTDAKPYAALAGERALNEHFARQGVAGSVEWIGRGYYAHYSLPAPLPLVSLIIPTRNGLNLMRQCIDSIVGKTTYSNYEIIVVDNGSDDPEALRYFESLGQDARIRVLRDDRPFNYSALNNAAVSQARGELVGLINNDIEVISPGWLSEMVSLALQPGVGAVGAKLLYPDDTLQHGGVVLGVGGVAGHANKLARQPSYGYFGRTGLIGSYSAVTAACLVVRKSIYQEVDGLNEKDLTIAFNDVDFCLRVREAGYRNVWTPYAELYHHESATRGFEDNPQKQARFAAEVTYMQQRWRDLLLRDPAYNPNLTLDCEDFSLAWPPRVEPLA